MNKLFFQKLLFLTFICNFAFAVSAQQAATTAKMQITADDYARAEKMLGFNTSQLVDRGAVRPHEKTLPKPKEDRFKLLTATLTNVSPVFGL